MICTEKEAITKWCPKALVTIGDAPSYNRLDAGEPSEAAFCLGSDCMMWCWDDDEDRGWCGLSHGDNR